MGQDEYKEKAWDYLVKSIEYLRGVSGNSIRESAKNTLYYELEGLLKELSGLETILEVGTYYKLKGYNEVAVARYAGFKGGEFIFDTLYSNVEYFRSKLVGDKLKLKPTDFASNSVNYEEYTLDLGDLPLHSCEFFKGKLFEDLLKGAVKK